MLATVTDKGQITLPKAIRDQVGIQLGTRIDFEVASGNVLKAAVLKRGSSGLFGLLQRPGESALSLDDMDAGIAAAVNARQRNATHRDRRWHQRLAALVHQR